MDLGSGDLLYQAVGPDVTEWTHTLDADYGARQLAWRVRAHNSASWSRWATAFYFGVDTVGPAVDMALSGTAGNNGWQRSPLTVRLGGSDPFPGSGLAATYLQPGDTRWKQVIPGGANVVDRQGEFFLRAYGRDRALNRSAMIVRPVKVDLDPPYRVEAVFSREATSSGWYTAPLTISVTAEDVVSGVADRLVRVDGGSWQTDTLGLEAEGTYVVEFAARDAAGNETEIQQTTAKLDLTRPAGDIALNGSLCQTCSPATANVTGGDSSSGLAHWTLEQGGTVLASGSDPARDVTLDGGQLPPGSLTLRLAVQDVAGWV
ncbi:MAG: hypothetical protein GY838_10330, partial [bacterium]|nr:hypothetical protein [bacterium]